MNEKSRMTMAERFGALLRWVALAGLAVLAASSAQAAPYIDNGNGTQTDAATGLTWMRCSIGQTWTGAACGGTANTYTWDQAKALTGTVSFAGQSDWRLPNIRELQSIVDYTAASPQINTSVFPQTPAAYFWSSSIYAGNAAQTWHVRFNTGETVNDNYASAAYHVRLTRGGTVSSMSLARPTSSYVDNGNGTATHTPTGLMWQRCAKGQTWNGTLCMGTATAYNGNVAMAMTDSFAGYTDWRLPTVTELATVADYSAVDPAANSGIFPVTPGAYFWSNTPDTSGHYGGMSTLWLVNFGNGAVTPGSIAAGYDVRLVRGSIGSQVAVPKFAYVANYGSATVSNYSMDPVTGALTPGAAVATGLNPRSVTVDPSGRFAYVANVGSNTVSVYSIDASTGALTAGAAVASGIGPFAVTVDPRGRFAYVVSYFSHDVWMYSIDQGTGALTAGAVLATGASPYSVTVDPSGRFAYVANYGADTVSMFAIDARTGALTAGAAVATGLAPYSVTLYPTGQFAYVANNFSHTVSMYAIDPVTGVLTAGAAVATGAYPIAVTVHPSGRFAYVVNNGADTVSTYSIDSNTGALTPGATVPTGSYPSSVSVDPSGRFAYVTNNHSDTVSMFSIDSATGALSSLGSVAAGEGPASIALSPGPTGMNLIVASFAPLSARLGVLQQFTVTGSGLTGTTFAIADCVNDASYQPTPANTANSITFRCTPTLPGPKAIAINGTTVPGATVNVDHPARLGNASARGIPAVQGVSLWNGNVHLQATDLSVPGKGVSFTLTRSYNSYGWPSEDSRGAVGNAAPWRFNWELKLGYVAGTDSSQIWVEREDGSGENFFKDSDGLWYPMDQGNFNRIRGDTPAAGQTTLLTREGLKYVFQNPDLGGLLLKILDHDGNGLLVARDAAKRVDSVTDASGRVYTFSYDPMGQLARVTDFSGRHVDYTWEVQASPAAVLLKSVTDLRGNTTSYSYRMNSSTRSSNRPADQWLLSGIRDPNGNAAASPYSARSYSYSDTVYGNWGAASVTDAMGNTWGFGYCARQPGGECAVDPTAAQGFETSTTPPLGASTVAWFDTAGRLTAQANANAKTSRTTPMPLAGLASRNYNLAGLATRRQSALGAAGGFGSDYDYTPDNAGNLRTHKDAENATTTRTWSEGSAAALVAKNLHRVTTFANATGDQTLSTFDETAGRLLSHQPPGLPATEMGYDGAGQVVSIKDARGLITSQDYDAHGNLIKVTGPDALELQHGYDTLGRVLTSQDKRGFTTTNTWDDGGNLTSVQDALQELVRYQYDANGNRTQMTDANGNVTRYGYDLNNRLKTVSKVNGDQTLTTTTHYDALGRVTSRVNANSHANSSTLDAVGNVLGRANALGDTTSYQYDDDNRVTRSTDPVGRSTDTGYDKVGRVTTVTTAAGTARPLTTSYRYDANGRMTGSTDPRGLGTAFGYDAAGRLLTLTDANGQSTRASYDGNGNLLTVSDPNGKTTTYSYDSQNRPLSRTDGNGQQWSNSYDANGNVKSQTVPGSAGPRTTHFTHDALNRVSQVAYPDASVVAYTYDANGNRLTMSDSTGVTAYSYDALDRLVRKTDSQGKVLSYVYDGVGNVTALGYPGGQSVAYSYDQGERLSSLTDWLGKTTSYTLNRAGQVTAALLGNGTQTARVFDASGRQISLSNTGPGGVISSHELALDGNGNITDSTVQQPLLPHLPAVNRAFSYDAANRLASVNGAAVTHDPAGRITALGGNSYNYNERDQITAMSGVQSASHTYNGAGQRVQRTLDGQTTGFVIDANRSLPEVLAETDGAGHVLRNYVYGYGLVQQIDSANGAHYYHFDPTGSTLALSDAAGALTDRYAYTPYGETTSSGTTVNPFKYVGKLGVVDDGNGLHYMRARFYRADIARFMSLDPMAGSPRTPQTLNRYAYASGNPVMGVDPSGLFSVAEAVTWVTGLDDYFFEDEVKAATEITNASNEYSKEFDLAYSPGNPFKYIGLFGNDAYRGMQLITATGDNMLKNIGGQATAMLDTRSNMSYAQKREQSARTQECALFFAKALVGYQEVLSLQDKAGDIKSMSSGQWTKQGSSFYGVRFSDTVVGFRSKVLGAKSTALVDNLALLGGDLFAISKDGATMLWDALTDSELGKSCASVLSAR